MTHDTSDPHGDGSMGSKPSQGIAIGWVAIGLLAFMALFTILVIGAGAMYGFK